MSYMTCVFARVFVRVCVCACVCACVRACVHACVRACVRARTYTYICTSLFVYLFTREHMCVCEVSSRCNSFVRNIFRFFVIPISPPSMSKPPPPPHPLIVYCSPTSVLLQSNDILLQQSSCQFNIPAIYQSSMFQDHSQSRPT